MYQVLWSSERSLTIGVLDESNNTTEQVKFASVDEMNTFIKELRQLYPANILWLGYFGGHEPVKVK